MKKFLLFFSFCLLCLTQIGATEFTVDFSKAGYANQTVVTSNVSTDKNVSIVFAKASAGTAPTYYTSGTAIRLYNGGTLTVSAVSGYEIKGISFKSASGAKYIKYLTVSTGNGSFSYTTSSGTYTTTGDSEVVFTQVKNGSNTTQSRIISITVTYAPAAPATQVATPETTAKDRMLHGAEFTISTRTEGATLYYTTDGTENWIQAESNSVTLNAPTEGESFTIKAYATKDGLTDSDMLEKTVTLYPPTPATALIDEVILTDTKVTGTTYKPFSNVIKYGAEYAGKCYPGQDGTAIQFNNSTTNGKGSAIFMTQSVGNVNKVVVDWNSKTTSGRKLQVYGQNTPYEAYTSDETKYIGANAVKGDLLGTIEYGTSTELYITGEYQYILVMEAGEGVLYLNSIKFIWNNPFTGSETTYNKENGTSNIKENKFVTLVDTQNNIAFSRKDADTGTIVGAAAKVNNDESNGGKFVTLDQNQIFIDEFQLVPAVGGFKLYGGTPFIRRYIGVDATGLTTTTDETAAAVVKFVQYGDGIVAQFTDGDYIVSDGTNFGKGTPTGTEAPASLAEGATLVPAYVFVSKGNNSTGVEDIEMVETEAPAQYYNLNGVEVKAGNLVPGIYIVRQGNKVSKQFIR